MHIWVDADACPVVIRQILFRAAKRTNVPVTLVANHPLSVPRGGTVTMLQVSSGFDVADNEIVKRLSAGDLVITSDIPLAAEVIDAGGQAISPRGERFSADTIKGKLSMRDFMETMRSSGVEMSGGPAAMGNADKQAFANLLDQALARRR
ncbi:YaiI/YqxD family protein [bacterium]|nr:YaiI/YqxD family protein [bacterium]